MTIATHTEIARSYQTLHQTDTIFTLGAWYRYANGLWTKAHELQVENEIWKLMEQYEHGQRLRPSKSIMKSILSYLQSSLFIRDEQMDAYPNLINLANGIYNLEDSNLYPHKPEYYLTTQLPFNYDPQATAQTWDYYIKSTFTLPRSDTFDPELVVFLQEAIGYSLTIDVSFHAMFWCLGEGSNGKGVLFYVLEKLAGEAAIPLNLNLLKKDQYQLANLTGKRIAFCSEANSSGNIVEDALIKSLVAGDTMTVRQIKKENFTLHPLVKLWWAMNRLPLIADTSKGFFRRVHVIPFNRVFGDNEKILNLKEQLDTELPGIFNWAMEGLQRLRTNGKFSIPEQVRKATEKYKSDSNHLVLFLEEKYDVVQGTVVQSSVIYGDYKTWCFENNFKPYNMQQFRNEMESLGYWRRHTNAGSCFENLQPKP